MRVARLLSLALLLATAACQQSAEPPVADTEMEAANVASVAYGSWPSPISAASTVEGSRSLHSLFYDEGYLYWVEGRPEESGRNTIMRWRAGADPEEILAAPWNVRTRVQ